MRQATGLPVEHVVTDLDNDGLSFHVTLAVANRTASGDELLEALKAKAAETADGDRHEHLFIVVVPQEGGDGAATRRARTRLVAGARPPARSRPDRGGHDR